jgi:hypothetical protein
MHLWQGQYLLNKGSQDEIVCKGAARDGDDDVAAPFGCVAAVQLPDPSIVQRHIPILPAGTLWYS